MQRWSEPCGRSTRYLHHLTGRKAFRRLDVPGPAGGVAAADREYQAAPPGCVVPRHPYRSTTSGECRTLLPLSLSIATREIWTAALVGVVGCEVSTG